MDRREFLGAAAAVTATAAYGSGAPLPRRPYKNGIDLSIIAFGGIVVCGLSQAEGSRRVAEAYDRGLNYFDCAPAYFNGEAELKLGEALKPYRSKVFLAEKTGHRDAKGAREELERTLERFHTDHVDLYQFHAVTKKEEVERIFGPKGAMETFQAARQAGKVRFIGFSAHSVEVAIAAMDRYDFDTILFPINFVLTSQANFGPQVIAHARKKGVGIMAIKGMAKTTWPESISRDHPHEKCWYEPGDFPHEAALGYRWTLSQPITAAMPPGDERYFRLGMDIGQNFTPVTNQEERKLMASAAGVNPIFHLGAA